MAKDHFVPQFYLRNFQIPTEPRMIYEYQRKETGKKVAIKLVAQQEDYYDLKRDDPKTDKDLVDRLLGRTEIAAASTLQKLLTAPFFNLAGKEKAYLAWFVAFLAARTPFQRNRFASLDITIRERGIQEMLRDELNVQDILHRHPELTREELDKAVRGFLKGEINLEFKRGGETEDYLMGHQIGLANNLVDILHGKQWNLIQSDSIPFVTSDNPVVTMPSPYSLRSKWGFTDGDVLLPLSPERALWLTNRYFAQTVLTIPKDLMSKFQFYSITQSDTSVFAHEMLPDVQQVLDSTEYGYVYKVTLPKDYKPPLRKRDEIDDSERLL
jgi:hypothetical protein